MTLIEYMKKKNEIVLEKTGIILIPKEQMVELEFNEELNPRDGDRGYCPYCVLFADKKCIGCPMHEANNNCIQEEDSTYNQVRESLQREDKELYQIDDIVALARQWNTELDDRYNNNIKEII